MSPDTSRFDGIDVLRGLSIIAVILLHVNTRLPLEKSLFGSLPHQAFNAVFWSGHYGVVVFFVVSGFLITTSILRRWGDLPDIDCKQFYRMRFARIAPCLLALLVILSVLHLAGLKGFTINPHRASLRQALFAAVTFHLNWLEGRHGYLPACWDVLWSLSVEEAFYVFYPLICKWIRNRILLVGIVLFLVVAGPFARTVWATNDIWTDYSYLSCMDGIAIGCLAAVFHYKIVIGPMARWSSLTLGTCLCLLVVVFRSQARHLGLEGSGLDVTFLETGTILMIFGMREGRGSPVTRVFRWFGRNSYEVYLTHSFLVVALVEVFNKSRQPAAMAPVWLFAILCGSGFTGYLLTRFYSAPLNRMLRGRLISGIPQSDVEIGELHSL